MHPAIYRLIISAKQVPLNVNQHLNRRVHVSFGAVMLAGTLALNVAAQQQTSPIPDAQVELNVLRALTSSPELSNQNIQSATVNGVVTLTGSTQDDASRTKAEGLVARALGVKKVVDYMTIGASATPAPSSSDFPADIQKLKKDCDAGDGDSCFRLGAKYEYNSVFQEIKRDDAEAIRLIKRGCELGDLSSCAVLGHKYIDGEDGLRKNIPLGRQYIADACRRGLTGWEFDCHSIAAPKVRVSDAPTNQNQTGSKPAPESQPSVSAVRPAPKPIDYPTLDNLATCELTMEIGKEMHDLPKGDHDQLVKASLGLMYAFRDESKRLGLTSDQRDKYWEKRAQLFMTRPAEQVEKDFDQKTRFCERGKFLELGIRKVDQEQGTQQQKK